MPEITTDYTPHLLRQAGIKKPQITQIETKIISNVEVANGYFRVSLYVPAIAKNAQPGQFMQVKVSDTDEPLLRRPFSIHRARGTNIEILYEVLGKGTQILVQKRPGEYLDIIGPLGNGFNYELRVTSYELRILVAGGMGVAPLVFLAEKLAEIKNLPTKSGSRQSVGKKSCLAGRQAKIKIIVLIGAKTKTQILCEKEFKELGCEVKIATDDGSRGFRGKVTELLREFLRNNASNAITQVTLYACGPRPMLKEIAVISKKYNIPAQISLEEHIACGIGACLGCAVNTKEGYKRVCKDGPIFKAREIIW